MRRDLFSESSKTTFTYRLIEEEELLVILLILFTTFKCDALLQIFLVFYALPYDG